MIEMQCVFHLKCIQKIFTIAQSIKLTNFGRQEIDSIENESHNYKVTVIVQIKAYE